MKPLVLPTVHRSQLLILKGVFSLELTQEPAKEVTYEPTSIYTEIPKKFVSVALWPKFSNLKCWECDRIPHSYPRFLPRNPEYRPVKTDTGASTPPICDTEGNFCDWSCVVSYVDEKCPVEHRKDLKTNISLFESQFTGRRRLIIPPAPEKTQMKEYCGNGGITPKEWRKKVDDLNANYELSHYKMEQFSVKFEAR